MSVDFYWRLPTHGDSSSIRNFSLDRGDWSPAKAGRITPNPEGLDSYIDYLGQVARAAEISGFIGGLVPSFPQTDDPWAASAALARETKTFHFMIAFQPVFLNPVQAARMSASLQRLSRGRLVYNIITGGGGPSQLWWGDNVEHDDRYARTTEFLDILKGVWKQGPYTQHGDVYQVENGQLPPALAEQDIPEIYFSGSSDAALKSASKHADYYLSWLEPFDALAAKFARVREKTDELGRKIKCSVRVEILARATEEEAFAELERGFANVDRSRFQGPAGGDSVGAARQRGFRAQDATHWKDLVISPNVWGGFSLLRPGPGLGLVGSYQQVAERLDELVQLGADSFILGGTPYLEDAYIVGEEVLPLVQGHGSAARFAAE